jgi:four helix bundle protein
MSQTFRELKVWQRSKTLAVGIYQMVGRSPIVNDRGLCDQMRRAAVSVCSNIAEGDSRAGHKENVQFFYIAKGSLAELSAQLDIAAEVHSVDPNEIQKHLAECDEISAMLQALINHRRL